MKFCAKCGKKLESGGNICPQCGYDLDSTKNKVMEKRKIDIQHINKNKKFFIIASAFIVLISFVFFTVGNSLSNPSKVVAKFEKAVASDDKKELASVLYCNDNRVTINEKNVIPLLAYFKDNPSYLNNITQDLNSDAIKLKNTKNTESNLYKKLNVIYTGKRLLFFSNYKIDIKPEFIEVKTNMKNVSFSLNDMEIGKSDVDNYTKECGPFLPGKYTLSANYKGKYSTLKENQNVDLFNNNNGKTDAQILKNANYIEITSEYPEAEIFVNGKATGVKVKDAQKFEPLSKDTKVYATITENGKAIKSSEYSVKESDSCISLTFNKDEVITTSESGSPNYINWDKVNSSSTLKPSSQSDYNANNVSDWNCATAWVEGDSGNGVGSWILLESYNTKKIRGIEISNGYNKSQETFYANNRVRKLKVEFSNGYSVIEELKDGYGVNNIINLNKEIDTNFVKITILDIYKGNKYEDTAITGVHVF